MQRFAAIAAAGILALGSVAHAGDSKLPKQLDGIDIVDHPGAQLPRDLVFHDQDGHPVKLGDYLDGKQPLLLVLAYYQCPMLCSIVLNGVVDGVRKVAFVPGKSYRILTVSIDPRDTVELAGAKRKTYLDALGKGPIAPRAWDFLIHSPDAPDAVKTLAATVGFQYRWDPETKQFAHAAGAFLFTPDGRLSRTLYGIQFPERDLRLALVEASQGKLGSAWDKILLLCYHYDPGDGYTLAVMQIMRLGGILTVVAIGAFLALLFRNERRKERTRRSRTEHSTA
jgi:protein SCO1/2